MTVRYYSSVASEKTLTGTITSGQTTMVVSNTIGLPVLFPYTLAVDYETATEELVQVSNAAGTTLTIARAIDGTSATSHTAGARVRHVSSARDFSDSRNHENAANGIHGLDPAEDIVGTNKIQTLTNKTLVNATGSLRDIDINNTPAGVTTFTNTPAGSSGVTWVNFKNGADTHVELWGNGNFRVLNNAAIDAATNTRRISVMMSDGTTERWTVSTSGQTESKPRSGTAASVGGFKVIDPGDLTARKAIQIRDSTDTTDRFVAFSGGYVDITSATPAASTLTARGAAAQSVSIFRVLSSAATVYAQVDSVGEFEARKRFYASSDGAPGDIVSRIRGAAAQTANLTQWQNSAGTATARILADGSADFTPVVTTTGIFTASGGWSTTSQVCVNKAGTVTINLDVLRTGGNIVADPGGDLIVDVPVGNIIAAFRPHTAYGATPMNWSGSNTQGTGTVQLNPSTGDLYLMTWSTGGTLLTGTAIRFVMTYPLEFV